MFSAKRPKTTFPGTYSFTEVTQMGTRETRAKMETASKDCQPDDPFNIQFTSGTTGSPKGATLSSFGLMNAAYFSGHRMKIGLDVSFLRQVRTKYGIEIPLISISTFCHVWELIYIWRFYSVSYSVLNQLVLNSILNQFFMFFSVNVCTNLSVGCI